MAEKKLKIILGARSLRRNQTPAEALLWKFLDNKGLCGFKFRRQHPIKGFILDFYCAERRLAIEIDGKIHDNQQEQDALRQGLLEGIGITFLRFKNADVLHKTDLVLKTIKRKLMEQNNTPVVNEGSPLHNVERGAERSEAG